jgi:hypothetical protein
VCGIEISGVSAAAAAAVEFVDSDCAVERATDDVPSLPPRAEGSGEAE